MHSATLITAADQFHPIDNQPLILPTLRPEHQAHMCNVSFYYSSVHNSLLMIYLPWYLLCSLAFCLFIYFAAVCLSATDIVYVNLTPSPSNNATQPMSIISPPIRHPRCTLLFVTIFTIHSTPARFFPPKRNPRICWSTCQNFHQRPESAYIPTCHVSITFAMTQCFILKRIFFSSLSYNCMQ